MDFLNHREGGMVFYQVFLLSPLRSTVTELVEICKRLREFLRNLRNLNLRDFFSVEVTGFRPRIRPQI
jgi:hypothetical protein